VLKAHDLLLGGGARWRYKRKWLDTKAHDHLVDFKTS